MIHSTYQVVANEAARVAFAAPLTAADDGAVIRQSDTGHVWMIETVPSVRHVNLSSARLSVSASAAGGIAPTLGDEWSTVRCTAASDQTVTIPPTSAVPFPIGTKIRYVQTSTGRVWIVGGAGVSVLSGLRRPATSGAGCSIIAEKIGTDTWLLSGDLTDSVMALYGLGNGASATNCYQASVPAIGSAPNVSWYAGFMCVPHLATAGNIAALSNINYTAGGGFWLGLSVSATSIDLVCESSSGPSATVSLTVPSLCDAGRLLYVVAVYDQAAAQLRLYCNGTLRGSVAAAGYAAAAGNLILGVRGDAPSYRFQLPSRLFGAMGGQGYAPSHAEVADMWSSTLRTRKARAARAQDHEWDFTGLISGSPAAIPSATTGTSIALNKTGTVGSPAETGWG